MPRSLRHPAQPASAYSNLKNHIMTNRQNHAPIYLAVAGALAAAPAFAQNVTVTQPAGGSFVVDSAANAPLFAD